MNNREYLANMLDEKSNADDYIVFTADLTMFENCKNLQVVDLGLSESLILPMAYGAWKSGKIPVIYTMCSYVVNANYEFFINTLMYSDIDIIILNAGAGFVYGRMGHGHYLLNDVAMFKDFDDFWFIKDRSTIYKSIYGYTGGKCYIRLGHDYTDGMYDEDDISTSSNIITTPTMYSKIKDLHPQQPKCIIENLKDHPPSRYVDWCYEDTKGYGIGEHIGIHRDRVIHITDPDEIPQC